MTTRTVILFVTFLSLAACQRPVANNELQDTSESSPPKEQAPEAVVTDKMATAEREAQIAMEMAELELGWALEGTIRPRQLPEGTWHHQDGSRICTGFLTRNIDVDFCAAEVPSHWVPFEFNGQTYYMQPLSVSNE